MANDVNRLIDMLYERIEDAKAPPLKPHLSMVDRDELLDMLDELRAQLPVEVKRAQELLAARDKFVEEAKRDVDRMMRQAELDAKAKISDSEVLYAAKEKARQIVAKAEDRSRQLYQVANEYAEDALARTSGPLWRRSSSPGSASAAPLPPRCRSSGRSWRAGPRSRRSPTELPVDHNVENFVKNDEDFFETFLLLPRFRGILPIWRPQAQDLVPVGAFNFT